MKQIFYMLLLMFLIVSCEKEVSIPQENEEPHTVTFNLSGVETSFSSSFTKASGKPSIDFAKFDVMFYLFKQVNATDDYQLVGMKPITESIFEMTVEKDVSYKYVVAAAKKTGTVPNPLVVAKDFYNSYTEVESASVAAASLLNNCFFDICGDRTYQGGEEVPMNVNPEIFADGFNLVTSFDFHTPVDIVLRRQVGAVEFKLTGLTPGEHTFKCSIPSDYYRLYLSQIVREDATKDYSSQNSGVNSLLEEYGVDAGDYYGKITNANSGSDLLFFTKEEIVTTSDNYNFYIYMPYTIASAGISTTSLYYGGNANGSEGLNMSGNLTLIVDGTSHSYDKPFPIYRNKKSYFLLKGDSELECKLGNIGLGDDSWNGQ